MTETVGRGDRFKCLRICNSTADPAGVELQQERGGAFRTSIPLSTSQLPTTFPIVV